MTAGLERPCWNPTLLTHHMQWVWLVMNTWRPRETVFCFCYSTGCRGIISLAEIVNPTLNPGLTCASRRYARMFCRDTILPVGVLRARKWLVLNRTTHVICVCMTVAWQCVHDCVHDSVCMTVCAWQCVHDIIYRKKRKEKTRLRW